MGEECGLEERVEWDGSAGAVVAGDGGELCSGPQDAEEGWGDGEEGEDGSGRVGLVLVRVQGSRGERGRV